jgi:hypothetical protein
MSLDKFLLIQFDEERKGFKKTDSVITDTMNEIEKKKPYLIIVCTQNSLSGSLWRKTFQTVLGEKLDDSPYQLLSKIDATRGYNTTLSLLRDIYNVRTRIYYDPDKIILGFRNNSLPTKSSFNTDSKSYINVYNSSIYPTLMNNNKSKFIIQQYAIKRTTSKIERGGGKILCSLFIQEPSSSIYKFPYNLVIFNHCNIDFTRENWKNNIRYIKSYENEKKISLKIKLLKKKLFNDLNKSYHKKLLNIFDNPIKDKLIKDKLINLFKEDDIEKKNTLFDLLIKYMKTNNMESFKLLTDELSNNTLQSNMPVNNKYRSILNRYIYSIGINGIKYMSGNPSGKFKNINQYNPSIEQGISVLRNDALNNNFLKDNILLVNYNEEQNDLSSMIDRVIEKIKKKPALVIVCTQGNTSIENNLQNRLNPILLKNEYKCYSNSKLDNIEPINVSIDGNIVLHKNIHNINNPNNNPNNNIITSLYYNEKWSNTNKKKITFNSFTTKYKNVNKLERIILNIGINIPNNNINVNNNNSNYVTNNDNNNYDLLIYNYDDETNIKYLKNSSSNSGSNANNLFTNTGNTSMNILKERFIKHNRSNISSNGENNSNTSSNRSNISSNGENNSNTSSNRSNISSNGENNSNNSSINTYTNEYIKNEDLINLIKLYKIYFATKDGIKIPEINRGVKELKKYLPYGIDTINVIDKNINEHGHQYVAV